MRRLGVWVLSGLALFLVGAIRWYLPADTRTETVGPLTTLAFGILTGVCQWLVLRRHAIHAEWWIVFSLAGWVAVLGLGAVIEYAQISFDSLFGLILIALGLILPFGTTAGGMVWLLRLNAVVNQAASSSPG